MALGALLINGCVAKEKFVSNATFMKKDSKQKLFEKKQTSWKKLKTSSNKACVDCYALPVESNDMHMAKLDKNEVMTYDYSNAPADTFNNVLDYSTSKVSKIESVQSNTYSMDSKIEEQYYAQPVSYINSSYGNYSLNTAIQIGAFRRYEGARIYAKKYDLLSSNYKVKIETGIKDNMPLHRVRIEGFHTRSEAQNFIARYGISDAFLVRK